MDSGRHHHPDDGILGEAYDRLHRTGPEFEGWLSNHGPMAAEALVRRGHGSTVHRWLDDYLRRLDDLPRGIRPIGADWREALGEPNRAGDWLTFFAHEMANRPWPEVLGTWWSRLLPGIVGGATHCVIRVGHAVRALRVDGDRPEHRAELGQALGYWAARAQPLPGAVSPAGSATITAALAGLPRIADRSGGIRARIARLSGVPGWPGALAALAPATTPAEAERGLADLVHRASLDYLRYGHAEPVMLVHAVTAPTAVRRVLPALDPALWAPSLAAAWSATAAVTAVYAPPDAALAPPPATSTGPTEVFARAARHGDEHVVKLADAVLDVHAETGDERVLTAAGYAARLI